jgi:hypothetical protein
MKPIDQWSLSVERWTLRDMMNAEIVRKGSKDIRFAHAVFELLRHRVDDPEISDDDVKNLTLPEVGQLGTRVLNIFMEQLKIEQSMPSIKKMVDNLHDRSVPVGRSGPDGFLE